LQEQNIMKLTMLQVARLGAVIFRQNVGQTWTGSKVVKVPGGNIVLENPQPVRMGLCNGSSDLIGWRSIEITPEMVGNKIAVFLAIESKSEHGVVSKDQRKFIDRVIEDGGIAGIARKPEDADELFEAYDHH